jgi:hypothetical protein
VKPPVWKTKEGIEIPITEMLDSHLLNVINHQENFAKKYHPDDWQNYLSEMYFFLVGEGVYRNIQECNDRAINLKIECLYDLLEKNAKKSGSVIKFLSGMKQNYRCATCSTCFDYHDHEIPADATIQLYKLCPTCHEKQAAGISDHIDRSNPNLSREWLGDEPTTEYDHSLMSDDGSDDYRWSVDDEDRD